MQKVLTVSGIKESEKQTISAGTTERELMFRAAKAVFENVKWKSPVAIVCGSCNNAGDGYALANILFEHKIDCKIFLLSDKFSESGKFYYEKALAKGIKSQKVTGSENFDGFNTIVDCIFGTGFSGRVDEKVAGIISSINSSSAYIVSVDINSGLSASNGMADVAVKSDLTISIGSFKPGHFLNMAKDYIGTLKNCDIGINEIQENIFLFENKDTKLALKKRKNFSNKGDFGYISVLGGSICYSGASKLANLAACACVSGAGVVKLAVPKSIAESVLPYLLESTLFPLSDDNGNLKFNERELDNLIGGTKAIAIGVGIGVSKEVEKILCYLLKKFTGTLIIDADALNVLSKVGTKILSDAKCKVILTPHLKEFSRLTGKSIEEIQANSLELSKEFAKSNHCLLLLKGPTTIVTDGNLTYLVSRGCPGMATAGSGDVLTGILASLCGYNADNLPLATATAAHINGLAGELAEKEFGDIAMTASDTVSQIKRAIKILSE